MTFLKTCDVHATPISFDQWLEILVISAIQNKDWVAVVKHAVFKLLWTAKK